MPTSRNKSRRRDGSNGSSDGFDMLTPMYEALLKEASREVSIRSDGLSQSVRMDELLVRKMMQMAVNGGQHSISNATYHINQAQRIRQQKVAGKVQFARTFKAQQQRLLDEAIKHGRHVDTVLPHPVDIIIDDDVGYEIIGPVDEVELKAVRLDCDKRDAAILQAALEERLGALPVNPGGEPSKHPANASAILVFQAINNALPERFQKTDMQIVMELMRYQCLSKRELLKRSHRAWASVNRPKPRGWRLPVFETLLAMLEQVVPAMIAIYPDVKSGKLSSVEAIAVKLQRMIGPSPVGSWPRYRASFVLRSTT